MGATQAWQGDDIDTNGVTCKVKRSALVASVNGTAEVVAAVTGKKIRVIWAIAYIDVGGGVVGLQSGAGSTQIALKNTVAGGYVCLPVNQYGWVETAASTALNMTNTTALNSITVGYIEAP